MRNESVMHKQESLSFSIMGGYRANALGRDWASFFEGFLRDLWLFRWDLRPRFRAVEVR
jgi:hypothetical protein